MAHRIGSNELIYKDLNDHDNAVIIDKEPDTCPVCKQGIDPIWLQAHGKGGGTSPNDGYEIQSIYKCPRIECQAIFTAYYTSPSYYGYRRNENYVFLNESFIIPYKKSADFDTEIEKLSPSFIKIFNQAKRADENGLDEICGGGYRKALEFLIKDFVLLYDPKSKKEVEQHSLGWVIANKVQSERIQITAGLAKDVGNDEVHYIRKMETLSVEDLKKLITLTTHWIVDELLTGKYGKTREKLLSEHS